MTWKDSLLRRPWLVGGLGLLASLWLLDSLHLTALDGSTLLSTLALGSGWWWWRQRQRLTPAAPRSVAAPVVDRARVEAQLADLRDLVATLAAEVDQGARTAMEPESPDHPISSPYGEACQALALALDRTHLQGVVVGERRSGKTTLRQHLNTPNHPTDRRGEESSHGGHPITWTEVSPPTTPEQATPALGLDPAPWGDHGGGITLPPSQPDPTLDHADLVLWVTEGDLTASALAQLRQHVIAGQGVIVAFNKTDTYTPADQHTVLTQLQRQGKDFPGPVAVLAVAANPRPITVRRHRQDGPVEEFLEPVPPRLADLETALAEVVQQTPTLVAATTLRQTEALRQRIQHDLNQVRRQRALPLIDQLQWVVAAAAFANPVPTLDVLATLAINGQLMMDLGKIYGFRLSLEEAKVAATTLAGLTVKLGLVELSTQVLTTVLKSHFATYLAGGTVQGLSAAYLTRMAGLSAMDYFEQAALAGTPTQALAWDAIAERLSTMIQQNRQVPLLQNLVKQGISRLKPSPALLTASSQPVLTLAETVLPDALPADRTPDRP